jgi:acrylyl-CoA reductase (NADPH)
MKALIINDQPEYNAAIKEIQSSDLPEMEVVVDVQYSSINYKDALAVTGKSPIAKSFPMVPGIDVVGSVHSSMDDRYQQGDRVLINGWGLGEKYWGGLAQQVSVKADWLVPLPDNMLAVDAASIGTAGYTAMLSVIALEENGVTPDSGSIIVTGATGGVGSTSIKILAQKGFEVHAVSGKASAESYLKSIGASAVITRDAYTTQGKPLQREQWAGAVDAAGGSTLANICAQTKRGGVVTACGLAESMKFPSTVAPFILRGVKLLGIDSVYQPFAQRSKAWAELESANLHEFLTENTQVIGLDDVMQKSNDLLNGQVTGRLVVDLG